MNDFMEIKEFDRISNNKESEPEYKFLKEPVFSELKSFIHAFEGDEDHADALEFFKIGYRRSVGDYISVNNYVGLIQMKNGFQIQILPKIDLGNKPDSNNEETKRVFLKMLRSMKDFPVRAFHDSNLKMDRMNLYEIFINMYLQEVRELVKHGLKSAYISRDENLRYYKGKLIVQEQILQNSAHRERFFVCYDEYQIDRPENRLIKATLLKILGLTSSAENQKEIRRLLISFELVTQSVNYLKDFSRVSLDRSMREYENLMRWSRVFLMNKSFTTFSGEVQSRSLLFPMEKVFEAYVAKQFKRLAVARNMKISSQDRGHYLFDLPRQQFALRPDIVITMDDGSKVIFDTKWKRLVDKPSLNYGISQADMYQMYAYAKKYNTSDIWLLYPVSPEMRNHSEITFTSNDGVTVRVFFVDVANIEHSLRTLFAMIE